MSIEASMLLELSDSALDASNLLGYGESPTRYDLSSGAGSFPARCVSFDDADCLAYSLLALSPGPRTPPSSPRRAVLKRQNSSPVGAVPDIISISDGEFRTLCDDRDVTFNVRELRLVPAGGAPWRDERWTFGELVAGYFRRRCAEQCRFQHKLFNALRITDDDPFYYEFLGVQWVDDSAFKVDKRVFGRLVGLKSPDCLFHQQGYFPANGFVALSERSARKRFRIEELEDIDFENVLLVVHQRNAFRRGSTEEELDDSCWDRARKL